MKKNGTFALLLMLSMLFPSCADEQTADRPPIPEESDTVSEDQTEPESIAETQIETELTDHVPELDFNGETITFSMNNLNVYEIGADELTGEITNDAVYNRNAGLEERFNVNIDYLSIDNPSHFEHVNFITNSVLAQDNAFDIASTLVYMVGGMILENMFLNRKSIPYVELENPWWAKGVNDPFTVDNKLFAAVSDTCISCMRKTNVFLFNKEIAENYQTENLYSVVEEGRWTLDYVINLTSDIYEDLNANGKKDPDDFFGLTTNTINSLDGFRTGCDQNTLRDTGEGLEIIINTEKW